MKGFNAALALGMLSAMVLGCGESTTPSPQWTKARKIAGAEQKFSHISGLVVDDKFAYVTMGGTIADQNEGTSGLRKVALDSGSVTILDDGKNLPQAEGGGLAIDEKFIYWNAGGKILRVSREGGQPDTVASEHVGIGIDMAVDDEKVYWANHGYYSPNSPTNPSPIYAVSKQGGKAGIFADQQKNPACVVADEKFIYWVTTNSILKQAKEGGGGGGPPQVIYQATNEENIDELAQDSENLYFGFRPAGESRWSLRKVSKQGGEPQIIVKTYSLKPVAIDEANIYFFDEASSRSDALCKVSKNGGEVVNLDTGYAGGAIAHSQTMIYFASLDDIFGFAK